MHCRRTSGAPFLTWAEFDRDRFELSAGTPGRVESRPGVTREFCSSCGTQLTYQHADEAGIIDVTVASFDVPGPVEPEDHVWCDRMVPWIHLDDDLPRYDLARHAEK